MKKKIKALRIYSYYYRYEIKEVLGGIGMLILIPILTGFGLVGLYRIYLFLAGFFVN